MHRLSAQHPAEPFLPKAATNPIIVGSGLLTDQERLIRRFIDIGAGAVVTKTIYTAPIDTRNENIYHISSGLLNNTTYSKRPLDEWLALLTGFANRNSPLIISIYAETPPTLGSLAARIAEATPAPLELGISCPHADAARQDTPERVYRYAEAIRRHTDTLFSVKLALGDHLDDRIDAAIAGGAHALTLSDSIPGLAFNPSSGAAALGGICGYSGPGIKPLVLAAIHRLRKNGVAIPILGCGGVQSGQDVRDYLLAGADAVQVYTALHHKCLYTLARIISEYREIADAITTTKNPKGGL